MLVALANSSKNGYNTKTLAKAKLINILSNNIFDFRERKKDLNRKRYFLKNRSQGH